MTEVLHKRPRRWVHAQNPNEHEIETLVKTFRLTERFVFDALDRDEIPRVEEVDGYTYIITRFAYESKNGSITTAPILFILGHGRLITVSLEELPSFDELVAQSENLDDPVLIMLHILLHIDAAYDTFIHDSSREIRHLLSHLGNRKTGIHSFIRFVHIEDDMNDFLSSLIPTNNSLKHLLSGSRHQGFARHRDVVNTVILNNEQSIQTCESNLKSLVSIRRTYALINSHSLDRTIKILTLASVLISIPTMFFSMYGMNVALPEQRFQHIFAIILGVCVFVVLLAFIIGRKKRIF